MRTSTISVVLDDSTGKLFDEMLHAPGVLKDSDRGMRIITKNDGTTTGAPIALITFPVGLPDGSWSVAQTVMTVRVLKAALTIITAKYPQP